MISSFSTLALNGAQRSAIGHGLVKLLDLSETGRTIHEFIGIIFLGGLLGLVCAIPAMIVCSRKGQEDKISGIIFIINVVAGVIAGLYLAIPSGIASLIYILNQPSKK